MEIIKEKVDILQIIGLTVLSAFFFMYTVSAAYNLQSEYLSVFLVAIGIAIIMLMRDRSFFSQYQRYYVWQFLFIVFMTLTVAYTANPQPLSYIKQMFVLLLKTLTVVVICKDFQGVKKLLACFSFVGLAVFIFLFSTGNLYVVGRLGNDLIGNANAFGLIATIFFVGSLESFRFANNGLYKIIFAIAMLLDIFLIILTGGRKFLLFIVVFIFTTLLFRRRFNVFSLIAATLVILVALYVGGYVIMNNELLYDAIGYRFEGFFSGEAQGVDVQSGLMERGIVLFLQRPFFGWGIASYQVLSGYDLYAHSNYVELLADLGLVGTLLFYSQYIYCFRVMLRRRNQKSEELGFYLPLLLSILVIEIFSITFNQTAFIPLFIMLISGFCYRLDKGCQII